MYNSLDNYNDEYDTYESYSVYDVDSGMELNDDIATGIIAGTLAVSGIFFFLIIISALVINILTIIGEWKIFTKAKKPGWASLIPIYNNWVLFESAKLEGAMSLICLVFPPFIYLYYIT